MSVVTDVIKLEDALKVKEKELEKCYCEIEQLKNEVHENHAMLSDVKIQLKTLEDVIEKEKAANIEATRALAALEDKSSQEKNAFQSEIASMQGEIDDLKQIMKNKDDELAKLKVLENLKVEMVELKKGMVEKERALLDLREEFSTMQVVVEKQQLELEESARAVVAQEDQWNFAFVMFHSEIQSKQKEVENLRTDLKVTMEELPKLELLRNEADEQIVELKKQKDSLDEDVKKYHEEILQLKLSCSVTEEELNKRGQELQNLKDIISDLNKEIHGKESTLNDLKEEYIKEKTLLCNELQLHADTNEQLQQKHAFECDELKKEIVKWETKTNQLLEEIQNKSSTISALEKLQSEHEHRIREILSERSELIKTYDDKVLDLETKNKCMKENVEGTESELMNLKSLFEKLKVNASDMMVKTEQTHELYIQKKQKLKSSLLEKEKEIEDLMKDLGRKEELHQELETRKSEIECSLVKLTSQVDSLKTDVCNYKQEIGKLNLELKSKEETLVMCEEELKTKQTTLADLELRLLEKDSEVKNLQDMNERQQTEILGYEKTIKREIIEKDQLMKNLEAATLENERVKEGYREKECLIKHIEETHLQDIQKKGDAVKLLQKHVGDSSAQISVLQVRSLVKEKRPLN